jgi:hypothetical protein
MRAAALFAFAIAAASLSGCDILSYPTEPAGNPSQKPYAGDHGSVYDAAANPAQNVGQVAYNPNQPLPDNLPADSALPAPANPNTVTTMPLTPMPGSPALGTRTR